MSRRIATVLVATAAALVLTGCQPAQPGAASAAGCDSAGWGPLSGCGSTGAVAQGDGADSSDTGWVVDSLGYHGPRGNGQHYASCTPAEFLNDDPTAPRYGPWKEVAVAGDDGSLEVGDPCPAGRVIDRGDGS